MKCENCGSEHDCVYTTNRDIAVSSGTTASSIGDLRTEYITKQVQANDCITLTEKKHICRACGFAWL